eukprot:361828-Chlamydomonas_euryale.AAC.2
MHITRMRGGGPQTHILRAVGWGRTAPACVVEAHRRAPGLLWAGDAHHPHAWWRPTDAHLACYGLGTHITRMRGGGPQTSTWRAVGWAHMHAGVGSGAAASGVASTTCVGDGASEAVVMQLNVRTRVDDDRGSIIQLVPEVVPMYNNYVNSFCECTQPAPPACCTWCCRARKYLEKSCAQRRAGEQMRAKTGG